MCSLFHDLAWLEVLFRDFAFSFHFGFDCLLPFVFGERRIQGALQLEPNCFFKFDLFFMFLDWNISHGTDIGFHRLSLIQHPACHLAHSAVLASKGAPITLFSYWFNSLLIEKLLRNGSQKRKGEDKGLVFSLLLIRSSFRVLSSPVAESKTVSPSYLVLTDMCS